ncbi:unnamed protein product [Callosobruchus maculatus]|uniref:Reverse transcriptase domain-containing protein n=1 Tax=Callosobruchus maculatus TaxID=64391 RepID=A0A653BTC7_CALMS|nr:unnamed protein product [Callosobruchus maculatus]
MFADDLKFWRVVDNVQDQVLLQADLDRLCDWCTQNKLHLNVSKCCYISFSRKVSRIETTYTINDTTLDCVSSINDLGVTLDVKLTMVEHISSISIKSAKLLGFVLRNCKYFSTTSIRAVYCSLVRSTLEYCSVVWSPYYQIHSDTLERVQHKFLRYCAYRFNSGIINHQYHNLEQQLSLLPLSTRRDISGAVFIFKVTRGLIDSPELLTALKFNVPNQGLRQNATFIIPFHRTTYGLYNPLDRYCRIINDSDVDIFYITLPQLKRSLYVNC